MRHLGIDYGTTKVGIALSDDAGTMGFPRGIMTHTPRLLEELVELIAKEHVGAIVMGESKNLSGEENPVAREARTLAKELEEKTKLPVYFESEVYTTVEARRAPGKEEKSRSPKTYIAVDDSAAAIILTSYLSRHG